MVHCCNRTANKVTGVIRVRIQGDFELVVFLFVENQDINRTCLALDLVFVQQVNVEYCTFRVSGAYDGVSLSILDDKLRCCGVTFGEVNVVVSVLKSASAIFCASIAIRIGPCEYRDIHFLRSDAHFDRNIQIP